ncbi:MAG TPA: Lrp/AsnC family transcriptional regulator, partial [Aquabacterium sp.]|nr:Lrp/AsnC family transcriptional regulator [Aquabacterium sp.]
MSPALDDTDRHLINHLHGGFPVCSHPYAEVAQQLGLTEPEVIGRLDRLLHDGWLTRFGPLFQIEAAGGQFVLAALSVPEDRFDEVTQTVNAQIEVAHNYRREHALNMWFVIGAESPLQAQSV